MIKFEFATARRIIFGPGTLSEVAPMAAEMGDRPLLVTGRNADRAAPLLDALHSRKMKITLFQMSGEPTIDMALGAIQRARLAECDLVIGIGGGSVIDVGKVVAALITNSGELMDYLEIIGKAQPLAHAAASYIAIPTTAGTGSEVTQNAVLGSPEHQVKVSMRSPYMLPHLAVVDPELTVSLPPSITAYTGLDAFTQLMEAFVSRQANPMTDGICREGLRRAAGSLQRAFENGSDRSARTDMCLASLFSGFALANAKLGAVHGLAGPLGGVITGAHGAICASLLPHVMETNVETLRMRAGASPALVRYNHLARILTRNPSARAENGISWVKNLCQALNIPPLSQLGLTKTDWATVVTKSQSASSMQGNPIRLTAEELLEILRKAI
jgi:alcohol dehydrogenase class IV